MKQFQFLSPTSTSVGIIGKQPQEVTREEESKKQKPERMEYTGVEKELPYLPGESAAKLL